MVTVHKVVGQRGDKQNEDQEWFCCPSGTEKCEYQCGHCKEYQCNGNNKSCILFERINLKEVFEKSIVVKDKHKKSSNDDQLSLCDLFNGATLCWNDVNHNKNRLTGL
jgi:hypothetical protein